MNTENLSTLKIHKLTQAQYDRELEAGRIDATALYLTPDEAEKNQNAFSNIKVGSTTIVANTVSDTLTLSGSNIAINPIVDSRSISFRVADGTTSAKGIVKLTDSTSSTSTTTAATPNSVKSAYDLANQAKTAAETAQTTADSKANSSHTHDDYMVKSNPVGTGSFSMNRKAGSTVGEKSFAVGSLCEASGTNSHAEGWNTVASGINSHAEGTTCTTYYDNGELKYTVASGAASHAEGNGTVASGYGSHSEGYVTTASGNHSHAEGGETTASGIYSHAEGYKTIAKNYQHASGKYNEEKSAPISADTQDTNNNDAVFLIGYGTSTTRANAFRVTSGGKCRGASSFSATGADFAELFEWVDGNSNNEDRRGLFVALDGDKIKLANADDDYIGVISGEQAFVGNTASEEWQGKYLTDVFGTRLYQEIETSTGTTTQYILNPDYNPNEEYVMRENRKEWGTVGLLGQVVVVDDGTCTVGSYVKPSVNGVGTASDGGYRVMKRIDETHIKVLVK